VKSEPERPSRLTPVSQLALGNVPDPVNRSGRCNEASLFLWSDPTNTLGFDEGRSGDGGLTTTVLFNLPNHFAYSTQGFSPPVVKRGRATQPINCYLGSKLMMSSWSHGSGPLLAN
jgi:hypothetical protein